MIEKTIIVQPSLAELREITKGLDNPISMESLYRETNDRFTTERRQFGEIRDYWWPEITILQRAIIVTNTVGDILAGRLKGGRDTILVTGAGGKHHSQILSEKIGSCNIIDQSDDDIFTITREDNRWWNYRLWPNYAFETQLVVTQQELIESRINRTLIWRTPGSLLKDKDVSPMEKNMIHYLAQTEGLEV
jgi:hypothetical protein